MNYAGTQKTYGMRNTYGSFLLIIAVGKKLIFFDLLERFDDDDDGRVVNNTSSVGQQRIAIDDLIATSRPPIDFETSVLKIMMSRYFSNRTRFKMAARFVISHVRGRKSLLKETNRLLSHRSDPNRVKVLFVRKNRQMKDVFRSIRVEHQGRTF